MENPQLAIASFFRQTLGIVVTVDVTSAEAATMSDDDVTALRELGVSDAMLDVVRVTAALPNRVMRLDFDRQTVTVFQGHPPDLR
jgi:hypothetical protein